MATSSVSTFCRNSLPSLLRRADGRRMTRLAGEVLKTDRWDSFDRFRETTQTVVHAFEQTGAASVRVIPIPTGGRLGTGRWVIPEAFDVRAATLDLVAPMRRRIADYRRNPFHLIHLSAATPAEGLEGELVVADTEDELKRLKPAALQGRILLTRMNPRSKAGQLADMGLIGVIVSRPSLELPDAVTWAHYGWTSLPLDQRPARLVGFAISANQHEELLRLHRRARADGGRPLRARMKVDARRYVGTHDLISAVVRGADDPQDEVWAIAHSSEPGAIDNASGVAARVEMARILEGAIAAGELARPRRSIRLLIGHECYSFFYYLEHARRAQPPLAGVCIDSVGARPDICDGRIEWRATVPLSARFVNDAGAAIFHSVAREAAKDGRDNRYDRAYRIHQGRFVSTADTLIGDPKYGFPCCWLTSSYRRPTKKDGARSYAAYHSSADTPELLDPHGLEIAAAGAAGYLYYLANAATPEALDMTRTETRATIRALGRLGAKDAPASARFLVEHHAATQERLKRFFWGGDREAALAEMEANAHAVAEASQRAEGRLRKKRPANSRPALATTSDRAAQRKLARRLEFVPRRTAPLAPRMENAPAPIVKRIHDTRLPAWTLFYADGVRSLRAIAELASCERGEALDLERVASYFEAHAELGYVALTDPRRMIGRARLVRDLRALGVKPGMMLMVHSSLSHVGYVRGGAETVVDALLAAVGQRGTLVMPSFNHYSARVFNPQTTPTTNGAIPDAFWRRHGVVRSLHPSHSVAAFGPKAVELCRGHLETGIWAQDSPIGKLIHGGGYILSLGVTHTSTTAYHVAENSMGARCVDPSGIQCRCVGQDGEVREVLGLAWRSNKCPVPPERLDETLDERKLQRVGKVGQARAALVKAIDLWNVRREHLRQACPTCPIPPDYGDPWKRNKAL